MNRQSKLIRFIYFSSCRLILHCLQFDGSHIWIIIPFYTRANVRLSFRPYASKTNNRSFFCLVKWTYRSMRGEE